MICKECNANVPEGAVFCPNCGAIIGEIDELEGTTVLSDNSSENDDDFETTILDDEGTTLLDEDGEGTVVLESDDEFLIENNFGETEVIEDNSKGENIDPAYKNIASNVIPVRKKNNKKLYIIVSAVIVGVLLVVVIGAIISNTNTSTDFIDEGVDSNSYSNQDDYLDNTYNDEINTETNESYLEELTVLNNERENWVYYLQKTENLYKHTNIISMMTIITE